MTATARPNPQSTLWTQPAVLDRFLRGIANVLASIWVGVGLLISCLVFREWNSLFTLVGIFAFVGIFFICVAAHELGHAVAAGLAGMSLQGLQVGWLFVTTRRRGWRIRWQRPVLGYPGFAWAFPDPARPMRPQMFWISVGGPIASALLALALWPLALWTPEPWLGLVLVAIGTNILFFVTNLLPTSHPSDGMLAWRWWRGIPEDHPELRLFRLAAFSNAGVRCHQLPADLVTGLEQGSDVERVNALWIRLKSYQNLGEWAAAAAMAQPVADFHAALDEQSARTLSPYRRMADVEIAFSRAMATADPEALRALPGKLDDSCPWILSRTQALLAGLEGRHAEVESLLDRARAQLDELSDKAWLDSELRMAEVVRSAAIRDRAQIADAALRVATGAPGNAAG